MFISRKRRREKGFTLTELAVGLFVSSIIVSVVGWSASSLLANFRAKRLTRDIANVLDLSRAKALRNRRYFAALVTRWPGSGAHRGGVTIKEGDNAEMSKSFDDITALPTRVSYILSQQHQSAAITRIYLDGKELKPTEQLEIFFSPSGRVCTSDAPYKSKPASCIPASFLICIRRSLELLTRPAKGVEIVGSGQIRITPNHPVCNEGTNP